MTALAPGALVLVGTDLGVVVDGVPDVPEGHLPVWYGEAEDGAPLVRTVPEEYCQAAPGAVTYH